MVPCFHVYYLQHNGCLPLVFGETSVRKLLGKIFSLNSEGMISAHAHTHTPCTPRLLGKY